MSLITKEGVRNDSGVLVIARALVHNSSGVFIKAVRYS